jgi:drug/metabolite transporter (DMT)-like permease
MLWILFALGAALSWGLYGPALHRGQVELGNPMRALLCVGIAYFLIGVLVPLVTLSSQVHDEGLSGRNDCRRVGRGWSRLHHICF